MLISKNDDPALFSAPYFDTEHAQSGFYHLSWSAGAVCLFVPDGRIDELQDMQTAISVIASRGLWTGQGERDGLELLFEDGSDAPFCIYLCAEKCEHLPPDTDQGGGFTIVAWTSSGRAGSWPVKYRNVGQIPCLEAWSEH